MSHFCLLKDPKKYRATDWDLLKDEKGRNYWLDHFRQQFEETARHGLDEYGRHAGKRIKDAKEEFYGVLDSLQADPRALGNGSLTILDLDHVRDEILRKHGLPDPYKKVKDRTNDEAIDQYKEVIRDLHMMETQADRWDAVVSGIFAGNMYDLGSVSTMHLADETVDFFDRCAKTKPRPWLVDDFDPLINDLADDPMSRWKKAVIFADNAGIDFVLGVMPLARELANEGVITVIAANEDPSLNDITAEEAVEVIQRLAVIDPDLAALIRGQMLEVVSTGSRVPLIDLSDVSKELNAATEDADLVILQGMGRAIESNWSADFAVDAVKIGLVKSPMVAEWLGGEIMDCVCKYEPTPKPEPEPEAEEEK